MNFLLVLSGGIVQLRLLGYLIFCLKIDLRNTNLLRKNPINNNDQQHKNLAHSGKMWSHEIISWLILVIDQSWIRYDYFEIYEFVYAVYKDG